MKPLAGAADNQNMETPEPGLYVTATPIGNLGDITYRAVELLKAADLILCEDTRQTAKLCAAYDIKTRRAPYHEHNAEKARPEIINKLKGGAVICLVSDAGTPLISDPGYKLVRAARDERILVSAAPGPSAAIAALSIAGAPSDKFFFAGFPPAKAAARDKTLSAIADIDATLIFYETAARLPSSLAAMAQHLGDRRAVVIRELTKLHEETCEQSLSELTAHYEAHPAKGEIVILVFPDAKKTVSDETLDAFLKEALKEKRVKDAAANAAEELGVPRNRAYARALKLKDGA